MPVYKDKVCRMCGKTFTPLSPNGKWCVECRPKVLAEQVKGCQEKKKARLKDNSFHTCDSPEKISKCLNCTRKKCSGQCDDVTEKKCKKKRKT